nr:VanZ family protein [Anaerolineaceae bacterium]
DDKQEILGRYLHILEYSILAYLLVRTLIWNGPVNLYLLLTGFFTSTLYALSDEYHQMFVSGRRFETGDLMLDTLGSGIGLITFVSLARKIKLPDNQTDK